MDDVPAGPASPGPRRPSLSVVVPVRDGGSDFERCLRRLRESTWTDYELIVVDDGSTDDSAALAQRMGAVVARHERPLGPAAARNLGAQQASAPLIFFLDADVAVYPETLARGMARFLADPGLTALFGSYDDQPPARGLVSQFRNLLHHFVHQQGVFHEDTRPAHTFWTGCGMIRRQVFLDFGGFDPRLYPRPAIEDIELGYRLTRTGHRILLARDVLATHMKRWTLLEMVRTDIFRRGVPWTLLIKRSATIETDLNVKPVQQLCVALTGLVLLALVSLPWNSRGAFVVALGSIAIVWLNRDFYRFLTRRCGPGFAMASLPVHLLYFTCCGLSVLIALFQWHILSRLSASVVGGPVRARLDTATAPIPRPFLARLAGRLARWTTRAR
jgi:glycosyltransferase involved in cell wall biosynthesis